MNEDDNTNDWEKKNMQLIIVVSKYNYNTWHNNFLIEHKYCNPPYLCNMSYFLEWEVYYVIFWKWMDMYKTREKE